MKTNIIIKKVWEDDISAEFNIKFETSVNFENFVVSGNFYLSDGKTFKKLYEALACGEGVVVFNGVDNNFCELTISKNVTGLRNIHYHLFMVEQNLNKNDGCDISINTGYIVDPAVIDRNMQRLCNFYNEPEGSKISLGYIQE